jgi:hypothetical protein
VKISRFLEISKKEVGPPEKAKLIVRRAAMPRRRKNFFVLVKYMSAYNIDCSINIVFNLQFVK